MSQQKPHDNLSAQLASLKQRLDRIIEAFTCSICHETFRAPIQLRCDHMFCSECIRRHLATTASCPHPYCKQPATTSMITPLRMLDAALATVRSEAPSTSTRRPPSKEELVRLVILDKKGSGARVKILQRLRENHLPVTGNLDVLAKRDKDFVIKWNANLDAAEPRSRQAIADAVAKEERFRVVEAKKQASATQGAYNMSFFSRKIKTNADEVGPSVPEAGDDHNTLIRKIRERKLLQQNVLNEPASMRADPTCKQDNSQSIHPNKQKDAVQMQGGHTIPRTLDLNDDFDVPPTPPSEPASPSTPLIAHLGDPTVEAVSALGKRKYEEANLEADVKESQEVYIAGLKSMRTTNGSMFGDEAQAAEIKQETYHVPTSSVPDRATKTKISEEHEPSSQAGIKKRPRSPPGLNSGINGDTMIESIVEVPLSDGEKPANDKLSGTENTMQRDPSRTDFSQDEVTPQKAVRRLSIHETYPDVVQPLATVAIGHDSKNNERSPDVVDTQPQSPRLMSAQKKLTSGNKRATQTQSDAGYSQPVSAIKSQTGTPISPAALQRMERNRHIAMERQIRFRERMNRSAMRQPHF